MVTGNNEDGQYGVAMLPVQVMTGDNVPGRGSQGGRG